MNMKVLVTGAKGQLGSDLINELARRKIHHKGTDLEDFDITDSSAAFKAVREYQPDVVIHSAAYTAVDKAEEEMSLCRLVNEVGTHNIALACKEVRAKMLYISTDYVFPGEGEHWYKPNDNTGPKCHYGSTKLAGEQAVLNTLAESFIVRISWVFGANGNNFVKTMIKLGEKHGKDNGPGKNNTGKNNTGKSNTGKSNTGKSNTGKSNTGKNNTGINVVKDQIGSPTYTADLAPLLCDMAATNRYGIYHATNEGVCSWSDFATEIFRQAGLDIRVNPIPTTEYPTKAVRPYNSRLDKSCLDKVGFVRLPHWKDALSRFLELV